MSMEFTGERVIPGHVDPDLWNEHFARYVYASRFCQGLRVLDAGCGAGYGTDFLSAMSSAVVGLDIAPVAVSHARETYSRENIRWTAGSASALPFADASFDAVVAFEVIEHLVDWPTLLRETRRVLRPGGVFVVSTPNKGFYAETRDQSGPNPFHEHEFDLQEFREALKAIFPVVKMVAQNHAGCVVFESEDERNADAQLQHTGTLADANFFLAVCSTHVHSVPSFVYVPHAANVLKERAEHIRRLQGELLTKGSWLMQAQEEHAELVRLHEAQTRELQASNAWAQDVEAKYRASGERVLALQEELEVEQRAAEAVVSGYQAQLQEMQTELEKRTLWAQETEARLRAEFQHHVDELVRCVALLDQAEATVVERTNWAMNLQRQLEEAQARLALARSSRWVKLGRIVHLGPELNS